MGKLLVHTLYRLHLLAWRIEPNGPNAWRIGIWYLRAHRRFWPHKRIK